MKKSLTYARIGDWNYKIWIF